MSELINLTEECISFVMERISNTPWRDQAADLIAHVRREIQQPCVVAVSGKVKAGKSTFVNALLGDDFAKTGVNETTATLTYFRYGQGDLHGTVRCYWKNGRVSDESLDFVNSLQGNDPETLRQAENISHLEVFLDIACLRNIVLVDTPGTCSVLNEHEQVAQSVICRRLNEETLQVTREATAVIYLLGYVADVEAMKFVDDFRSATGGQARPMNAVGIMAQIDKSPEVMRKRYELAGKLSDSLKEELNTVVPVSALLYSAVERLCRANELETLRDNLLRIAPQDLKNMLRARDLFDTVPFGNCPFSPQERKEMRKGIEWTVFKTIMETLVAHPLDEAERILREMSGFDELRETLQRHFFQRGQLLQCFHAILRVKRFVDDLLRNELWERRKGLQELTQARDRYLRFLASANGDRNVAEELKKLVSDHFESLCRNPEELRSLLEEVQTRVEDVFDELRQCSEDFEALEMIHNSASAFNDEERVELRNLFGQYGLSREARLRHLSVLNPDGITARIGFWQRISNTARRDDVRMRLGALAAFRYGLLYSRLLRDSNPEAPS